MSRQPVGQQLRQTHPYGEREHDNHDDRALALTEYPPDGRRRQGQPRLLQRLGHWKAFGRRRIHRKQRAGHVTIASQDMPSEIGVPRFVWPEKTTAPVSWKHKREGDHEREDGDQDEHDRLT